MTEEKKSEEKKESVSAEASASDKSVADKEEKVKVPKKFKELVEAIESMTVLDLAELVKVLEKKFGVSAVASAPAAAAKGPSEAAAEEEKSIFDIELTEAGSNRIEVIKAIREITQQGLRECKDLVDNVPQVIKKGEKKEEAEKLKKKLEDAGAKVTLK